MKRSPGWLTSLLILLLSFAALAQQQGLEVGPAEHNQQADNRQRLLQATPEQQQQRVDIRRQRAAASQERQLAQEKIEQLYAMAITRAIETRWIRPASVPLGARCPVQINQIPGGEVIDLRILPECSYDQLGKKISRGSHLESAAIALCRIRECVPAYGDVYFPGAESLTPRDTAFAIRD